MHEWLHNAVESSRHRPLEACVYCGAIQAVERADMQGPGGRVGSKAVVKVGLRALPISH